MMLLRRHFKFIWANFGIVKLMKIYYVTGISGAGKSKVRKQLTKRGYLAYDGDENGLTKVRDYKWHMSRSRLQELANEADTEIMFVCGTASNRYDLWDMFDKVFCLSIDQETLVHRLTTRTNNDFGKDPKDLADVLGWHKSSEHDDVDAGAILIDATKAVEDVVDQILKHIN